MSVARPTAQGVERLLRPRSIAIVGASPNAGSLGASVLGNLDRLGFTGAVHLINPKRDQIGGRPCLRSVDELPLGVDAAVLAIPQTAVLDTLRSLSHRKVGAAIIFSARFAEAGAAGLEQQREMARIASQHGMIIEGPNCLGMVNYIDGIALTFVEIQLRGRSAHPGVGVVSQSGALAAVVGVTLVSRDLPISYSISTGNEAASGVEDFVEYLLADPHTGLIALIVEQFRQPRRFLQLASQAAMRGKPIVLLHPGRSSAARQSAVTHTGALAGDYEVMRTQVERCGVLVASGLEEFADLIEIMQRCPITPSGGAAVLTESGAFKALALDVCEQIGLQLPLITDDSAPQLRAALPEFVPVSNPVDVTAQGLVDPDLYRRTLAALFDDQRFGSIILSIIQTDANTSRLKFPSIIAAVKQLGPGKPMIYAGLDEGAAVPAEYIQQLRALGVPCFPSPERAFRAVARLNSWAARETAVAESGALRLPIGLPGIGVIAEYRSKEYLSHLGIPFPPARMVQTLEQAQRAALEIGFPVVLKAQAAQLPHKSDAGAVLLGLDSAEAIATGWHRMHDNLSQSRPELVLDGLLLEKMVSKGVEMIVGARNDPQWGPIVLVGFGGVQAEILQDVRLLAADLPITAIVRELQRLKASALLRGYRGATPLDVDAVANIVARTGRLMLAEPSILEIDLNPIVVYAAGQKAVALDALMLIDAVASST